MESEQSCKTNYIMKVKESDRRPFVFILRLNIALHDSYQADKIFIEIEEWKPNFSGDYVKSFRQSFIKCIRDVSCI